jgi:nitrogen regulatory protein PII
MLVALLFQKSKEEVRALHHKYMLLKVQKCTLQIGDKYKLEVIISDSKENDAIKIIRENSKIGKIFILPVARAVDIESGQENEMAI